MMATATLRAWGSLRGGEYFLFDWSAGDGGAVALVLPDAGLTYVFVTLLVVLSIGGGFLQPRCSGVGRPRIGGRAGGR
jgi:hypothetical protein